MKTETPERLIAELRQATRDAQIATADLRKATRDAQLGMAKLEHEASTRISKLVEVSVDKILSSAKVTNAITTQARAIARNELNTILESEAEKFHKTTADRYSQINKIVGKAVHKAIQDALGWAAQTLDDITADLEYVPITETETQKRDKAL